ncbi:MAG: hypothetical protein HKP58_08830 [Desulfatitalea sp.]|nr:ParD-like family protein [Desulfatitalea sp.]NNK00503.1 hypothetical protein [Desulfatitalea sp.]
MATKSIRLDAELVSQAKSVCTVQRRSIPHQIEYWATLGRLVSSVVDIKDAFAVLQGLKRLRVEPMQTTAVDSDTVFGKLEADRRQGFADKPVTSAPFYFEASPERPGFLDKVNTLTGERRTGKFTNGEFTGIDG